MKNLKPKTKKILAILISSVIFAGFFITLLIKNNTASDSKSEMKSEETSSGGYAAEQTTASETIASSGLTETVNSSSVSELTETQVSVQEQSSEAVETEAEIISETESDIASDGSFDSLLLNYGFSREDLGSSEQLIMVESSGSKCTVTLYEKNDNWNTIMMSSGIVGKKGVSKESCEGDYCTPYGLYSLGFAFGSEEIQDLKVEYRVYNDNCYWVDDPESSQYNRWVESDSPDWNSAEHLSDYPDSYRYALVINYNMDPVVPGAGSAIFLHCATGEYTAGCVAVPEEKMLDILRWTDSEKHPMILIV